MAPVNLRENLDRIEEAIEKFGRGEYLNMIMQRRKN